MLIDVRRVSQAEARQGASIIVKAYAEPPWDEDWSLQKAASRLDELMNTPGCIAIAAFKEEEIIGFAFGLPHTSAIGRGLQIAEVAILPQHQRQGIGSRLLLSLEKEASHFGYVHLWLVSRQAGGAAHYYQANGYRQSSALCVYSKRLG
ncbi:acetyltransferase [Rhizobium sp. AC44/96]|uniref:GNAT family N-acetyltransferase n=1 Tax=unclassified Rhizobium TaxID=2613769 RepID=UPI00080FD4E6|nr:MULTISPECIES: GNAT family N-acetyltransferase [unclassified Rhizobium]MDM9620596.1 GNAT family N-acetyltransferase [Rhizobium sp. S96]OCJ09294.1 acetyltransferase [Rhizobium sp. AC44/96]